LNNYGDIFAAERSDARSKTSAEATTLHHWEDKKSEIQEQIAKCHSTIAPLIEERKTLSTDAEKDEVDLQILEIKEAHGLKRLESELDEANKSIKSSQQGLKEARVKQRRWARRAARRANGIAKRGLGNIPDSRPVEGPILNKKARRRLARAKS